MSFHKVFRPERAAQNLEVIGNNIANASTFGAKSAARRVRRRLRDALGGSDAIGIGVSVAAWRSSSRRATSSTTDNPLDLAINGAGFFQVDQPSGDSHVHAQRPVQGRQATASSSTPGLQLTGYPADATGIDQRRPPHRAADADRRHHAAGDDRDQTEMNLDSRVASPRRPQARRSTSPIRHLQQRDLVRPSTTRRAGRRADLLLPEGPANTWNVYVTANGTPLDHGRRAGAARRPSPSRPTAARRPRRHAGPSRRHPLADQRRRRGDAADHRRRARRRRRHAVRRAIGVTDLTQDGYAAGQLTGVHVRGQRHRHRHAIRTARPSRRARSSSRLPQPAGPAAAGRQRAGPHRAPRATRSSARRATATSACSQAGALEESNVDLTAELVNMITAQRIYQANAQTIKTQDQVLQTLVNLR